MGGHAGSGNDDLDAVSAGLIREFGSGVGCAVGREDTYDGIDPEVFQLVNAVLHDWQVAVGTHNYRNRGFFD